MGNEPRNPLVTLAILKAVGEKAEKDARMAAASGKYKISSLVRLEGTISVGEDTTATNPAKLCPWKGLAIALSMLNEASQEVVLDKLLTAYRSGEEVDTESIKKRVAKKVEDAKEETRDVRRGQVRYVGDVEIIEQNIALCL